MKSCVGHGNPLTNCLHCFSLQARNAQTCHISCFGSAERLLMAWSTSLTRGLCTETWLQGTFCWMEKSNARWVQALACTNWIVVYTAVSLHAHATWRYNTTIIVVWATMHMYTKFHTSCFCIWIFVKHSLNRFCEGFFMYTNVSTWRTSSDVIDRW